MLNPFICGGFNHQQLQEEDDDDHPIGSPSPCSTPRKSRKSCSSNKDSNKNPYSTLGLDKFSALLAELQEKRQKIYSQVGSDDISLVRFVYSSSNDWVPIIVKLKDQNKIIRSGGSDHKDEMKEKEKPRIANDKSPRETSSPPADHQEVNSKQPVLETDNKKNEMKRLLQQLRWNLRLHKWRRPSYYMPAFIIFILLFLAFFGRSAAILCTSIGWYLVPTLSSSKTRPPKYNNSNNKKQLVRRFSELSTRSNKNFNPGDAKNKSPHGRQNSF